MENQVIGLVLLSAFLHPLWNALLKRDIHPEAMLIGLAVTLSLLGAAHSVIFGYPLLVVKEVWRPLALSVVGEFLFGTFLVMTLKRGALSTYYPIIRSTPLFVVVVSILFLDQRYTLQMLTGIAMVLLGAFVIQWTRRRMLDDPVTLVYAVIAMVGTGLYSLADSVLMRTVAPPVRMFWVFAGCALAFFVTFAFWNPSRRPVPSLFAWATNPARTILAGMIYYSSYLLILIAFELGGDVAAVTSVRQASIPFSVLIGAAWLRESDVLRKLWASVVLAAGIGLIALSP